MISQRLSSTNSGRNSFRAESSDIFHKTLVKINDARFRAFKLRGSSAFTGFLKETTGPNRDDSDCLHVILVVYLWDADHRRVSFTLLYKGLLGFLLNS